MSVCSGIFVLTRTKLPFLCAMRVAGLALNAYCVINYLVPPLPHNKDVHVVPRKKLCNMFLVLKNLDTESPSLPFGSIKLKVNFYWLKYEANVGLLLHPCLHVT